MKRIAAIVLASVVFFAFTEARATIKAGDQAKLTYQTVDGKTVGLANKECMVAAGELITAEARRQGKPLLPIDSEHNAVHQCLRGADRN